MQNLRNFGKGRSSVVIEGQNAVAFFEFRYGHLNGALAIGTKASYRRRVVVAPAAAGGIARRFCQLDDKHCTHLAATVGGMIGANSQMRYAVAVEVANGGQGTAK